jgi:preprotein translocase YajC subunit
MNPFLFVWIALLAAVFWFMILRPQRNAKRRAADLSQSLDAGDEVVTIGGLYGRVVTIDDREVELEVADLEDDELEDDDLEGDDEIDDEFEDDDESDDEPVSDAAPKADESIGR